MKIACLQFAPRLGDIEGNLKQADAILGANTESFDLLVLPELAFTGWNFKSLEHVRPFLEHTTAGQTSLWARTKALNHRCVVMAGYPEIKSDGPNRPVGYYSSTIIVDSKGDTIANQRKCFLYLVEDNSAKDGAFGEYGEYGPDGTFDGSVETLGNVSIGVWRSPTLSSSDINAQPFKFEPVWVSQDFTNHIVHRQPDVVVLSIAWPIPRYDRQHEAQPDWESLRSWLKRLRPLIQVEHKNEVIVVLANRCGSEDGVQYAGTSAVLGIKEGVVSVYGILGRDEEGLLIVDTRESPVLKEDMHPGTPISDSPMSACGSDHIECSF